VLGSECYDDDKLRALDLFEKNFVLSLDFSAQQQPLGSARLFNDSSLWPEKVIIMTLARVGSALGVDVEKLLSYQASSQNHTLIASGGIRDKADLLTLKNIGIDYALCASALHAGTLSATDLAECQ
jgi:phosphoribosylformimino-5-aminoimidazole carboxamide ribotide isomerase